MLAAVSTFLALSDLPQLVWRPLGVMSLSLVHSGKGSRSDVRAETITGPTKSYLATGLVIDF